MFGLIVMLGMTLSGHPSIINKIAFEPRDRATISHLVVGHLGCKAQATKAVATKVRFFAATAGHRDYSNKIKGKTFLVVSLQFKEPRDRSKPLLMLALYNLNLSTGYENCHHQRQIHCSNSRSQRL